MLSPMTSVQTHCFPAVAFHSSSADQVLAQTIKYVVGKISFAEYKGTRLRLLLYIFIAQCSIPQ